MSLDIAQSAIAMQMTATRHKAQIAILKKSHEMDMALIAMLDETVRTAPPAPGTGRVIDKSA